MARNYKRDRKGRFAKVNSLTGSKVKSAIRGRRAAAVPYARGSLRSGSTGINAGIDISPNFRVSAGGYIRVQRKNQGSLEQKIRKADDSLIGGIAGKITKDENLNPLVRQGIRKARQKAVNTVLGGQKRVPYTENAYGRLTTSQTGMPSVSVRLGQSKVTKANRVKAISDYNAAMERSLKGRKVKKPRPQRRGRVVVNPKTGKWHNAA